MERSRGKREFVEDINGDNIEMLDTTGVVLKFNEDVPDETITWIRDLIRQPILNGGAGLRVKEYETDLEESSSKFFIVSAVFRQFLIAAERYKLRKLTNGSYLVPFMYANKHDFQGYEDVNSDFFSPSEKQFLLKQMLNHIVCENKEYPTVPNFPKVKIYEKQPILQRCIAQGVLEVYPLHHFDTLKPLKRKWYMNQSTLHQPIDEIKSYFGETIALYFAFLGFYTQFLIPPAIIGLLHWFMYVDEGKADNFWYAIINVIWSTIFLEIWKRKGSFIAFEWGRLTYDGETNALLEEPRPEYQGDPHISSITGLLEPYYPSWRRRMKIYFVSYPLLLLSLSIAVCCMFVFFEFREQVASSLKDTSGMWYAVVKKTPNVLYAVLIYCANFGYGKVAKRLNDWENHRIQSSYNNHLIVKLVCFYSINSFLPLFYIAFYLRDMTLLRQQLATQLVTQQFIQQIQESVLPYVQYKRHIIEVKQKGKLIQIKKIRDPKNQVVREGNLPRYSDTFGDYLEMFTQFGYVFMFSAVYPLAAFWAVLNNVIELRTDAFKLCKLHQRPFTHSANSIGVWQNAFELMSIIAVVTNCALIALSKTTQTWFNMESNPVRYVLILVAVEHLLIVVKLLIAKLIPDIPGHITKLLAKAQFKTEQEHQKWKQNPLPLQRKPSENHEEIN